ncbi:hypothetical protein ASPZODRAFT_652966 [Penicilliopsis zonata CBS 506.65]|uniref:ORC6 first cyclin-like domain-containing protein n=1 Tax=Penicilliopsis zonata CBS 506.65 TaxID=1073090 RepID=A0A1L9SCJ1_9EURO|nr:hypothetical protein ASPZODRAFT_652966 [Penicilliopsis zonata CBS 506.65]OJJ44935.1 hypothetical protein ASPZODRAFT_652966 [Penicilliopsis zonata CBS 506.65]
MNNRPVEQALSRLLPTHAGDLPPELVSLALSLVGQSRSFSASLKPEEEIARPYACAEIACKRLSRALKLPPLLGHPPCPPRVYQKLYQYLDRSLGSGAGSKRNGGASAPGTPTKTGSAPSTPTKGSKSTTRTPSRAANATPRGLQHTPSKSTPLKRSANDTPKSRTAALQKRYERSISQTNGLPKFANIPDAPVWVMTAIRVVCKTLSTPAPRMSTFSRPPISRTFPPHIFTGISSILYFISERSSKDDGSDFDEEMSEFLEPITSSNYSKDKEPDEELKELVYALVVAVYFIVLSRRRNPRNPDTESAESEPASATADQTGEAQIMDKKTFSEMRLTALNSLGLPSTERKHREDVDQWITTIMETNWAHGQEWFENIPAAGEIDGEDPNMYDEERFYDEDEDEQAAGKETLANKRRKPTLRLTGRPRGGLLPGLGTMMQDRVDWLSDERREDYAEWKADLMRQIEMEQL